MGGSDGVGPFRHATDPPPRAFHGGTNGEVSWLRDSTRLPGFPVAVLSGDPGRLRPGARYSGGAAPGLHRLPSKPRSCCFNCSARTVYRLAPPAARDVSSLVLR